MKVSWNLINGDMDQIVEEYERLYVDERNFSECEKILKDIFNIFSYQNGIKLDQNEDFNHIFHQLYSEIQGVMNNNAKGIRNSEVKDYNSLKKYFTKISQDVFKTAEIRDRLKQIDPSNTELKKAFKNGIVEAEKRKVEIQKRIDLYKGIEDELYDSNATNLKGTVERELISLGYLSKIEGDLIQIESYKNSNGLPKADIDANNEEIKKLYQDIQKSIEQLKLAGQIDQNEIFKVLTQDITDAKNNVNALKIALNQKTTTDVTTLRDNLQKVSTANSRLIIFQNIDFSKMNPSTEKGRKAVLDALKPITEMINGYNGDLKLYNREIIAFNNQLQELEKEEKFLQEDGPSIKEIKNNIPDSINSMKSDDLDYYSDMVKAQMYGNKEYKAKYARYLELFKKHIKKDNSFVLRDEAGNEIQERDSNGNMVPKIGKYSTVDYASMQQELDALVADPETASKYDTKIEDIVKFLQLEEYKSKLERVTKITAGDKLASTEYKSYEEYVNATTPEEKKAAKIKLKEEMVDEAKYLKTYHYATNDYKFHKEHHRTAGKYADTYVPMLKIKDQDTASEKAKAVAHNIYAFSRWRNPLKVKGIGRKALTMGSNVFNIATVPVRLPLKAVGVAISNIKYGDEKDPNPYNGRNDARRGARVDYYIENGNNSFVARAKGWIDEIPFVGRNRKERTENAIVDRQIEEIRKNLDHNYEMSAVNQTNQEIQKETERIDENRRIRTEDARIIASSKETQGDIFREPSDIDEEVLKNRTLARLALEYEGVDSKYVSNTGDRNPVRNPRRNKQFDDPDSVRTIRPPQPVQANAKSEIRYVRPKIKDSSVVSADPIGRAIRSKEIKNTLTRFYTIPYLLALKGERELVKYGIRKIKDTMDVTTSEYEKVGTEQVKVPNGGHYEDVVKSKTSYVEGNTAGKIKLGDLEYGDTASFEHSGKIGKSVSWNEAPTSDNIQAMSLDFTIPDNLDSATYEKLLKLGYKANDRINYSIADEATKNLCNATGKSYATDYIDGLFKFDDNTVITDAVEKYFPEKVSSALDLILESDAYSGKAGVDFLTDSFATSHGISNIMQEMRTWGTGWAKESVNSEALSAAREMRKVITQTKEKEWVTDYILKDKDVMKLVEHSETIPDITKIALKNRLNKINNGVTGLAVAESVYELSRKANLPKKETGREIFE